jgi:hypothetical protein
MRKSLIMKKQECSCYPCSHHEVVIIMYRIDVGRKRVLITHQERARNGRVELATTFDLSDVPDEKLLLWAATNRLTRWLAGVEIGRLTIAEVKEQLDNLVIECGDSLPSPTRMVSREETIIMDNIRKILGEGPRWKSCSRLLFAAPSSSAAADSISRAQALSPAAA